ncbi:MAG: PQQ-binding-like beta-propeller repeat protein, partial [Promethearchaeota archaeon]
MKHARVFPMILLAVFALTLLMVDVSVPQANQVPRDLLSDWPMFRRDPAHTGYTSMMAPFHPSLIWTYETGHEIVSSPAAADGKIYIGAYSSRANDIGYVYCLNAKDGTLIWKYRTEGQLLESSPAAVSGRIYLGASSGDVYCLDADDGRLIWRYSTGEWVRSSPIVVNERVYIGSGNSDIG